ncbi:MAG: transcriptional regulator GcvA [Dongiaceae bacterium]
MFIFVMNRIHTSSAFRRLPSIQALTALEAAIRHESFTRAADELGLTQGAVSHLIKMLEAQIGLPLFRRQSRQTVPTAEGRRLAEAVYGGLSQISDTLRHLTPSSEENLLRVTVYAGFAVKWLFPRLIRFEERHPEITLRISAIVQLAEETADDADVVIRYGVGRYPGMYVEKLLDEELMFPVCSPRTVRGSPPLRRPEDLARHRLLHDDVKRIGDVKPSWRRWLKAAGVEGVDPALGVRYGLSTTTLQAAIEGLGIALGRSALVADDLAAGRLVCPFGPAVPSRFNYYFVCRREKARWPAVVSFLDWLRTQSLTQNTLNGFNPLIRQGVKSR